MQYLYKIMFILKACLFFIQFFCSTSIQLNVANGSYYLLPPSLKFCHIFPFLAASQNLSHFTFYYHVWQWTPHSTNLFSLTFYYKTDPTNFSIRFPFHFLKPVPDCDKIWGTEEYYLILYLMSLEKLYCKTFALFVCMEKGVLLAEPFVNLLCNGFNIFQIRYCLQMDSLLSNNPIDSILLFLLSPVARL